MKKAATIALIVLSMVCLLGCIGSGGHYTVQRCLSRQSADAFSMAYDKLDGTKAYTLDVEDNTALAIDFVTKSGVLSCTITDKSGKEYYHNDSVQTQSLTVPLGEKGKYTVRFAAEEHTGSFSVKVVH